MYYMYVIMAFDLGGMRWHCIYTRKYMQASKRSKLQMWYLLAIEKSQFSCSNFPPNSMHYEHTMSWLPLP